MAGKPLHEVAALLHYGSWAAILLNISASLKPVSYHLGLSTLVSSCPSVALIVAVQPDTKLALAGTASQAGLLVGLRVLRASLQMQARGEESCWQPALGGRTAAGGHECVQHSAAGPAGAHQASLGGCGPEAAQAHCDQADWVEVSAQ